ncbi:MAG: hypothetical protein K2N88_06310, partial [Muribaculaceae bacterium]|nr:hypothetical protein [Muribaculaceae bacterium]
ATCGTLVAGGVINRWCDWQMMPVGGSGAMMRLFMGDWFWPWIIFALYALVIAILWMICFGSHAKLKSHSK